jgi:hypothetical protein
MNQALKLNSFGAFLQQQLLENIPSAALLVICQPYLIYWSLKKKHKVANQ